MVQLQKCNRCRLLFKNKQTCISAEVEPGGFHAPRPAAREIYWPAKIKGQGQTCDFPLTGWPCESCQLTHENKWTIRQCFSWVVLTLSSLDSNSHTSPSTSSMVALREETKQAFETRVQQFARYYELEQDKEGHWSRRWIPHTPHRGHIIRIF